MSRTLRGVLALLLSATWIGATAAPAAAGGGGCHAPFTDETTTEVRAELNCFSPHVARVSVGDRVTWSAGALEAEHTVTGMGFGNGVNELLPSASDVRVTFTEPGVFPYACLFHPGMVGAIVVGDGASEDHSAAAPVEPPASPTPPSGFAGTPTTAVLAGTAVVLAAGGALVARRRRLLPG